MSNGGWAVEGGDFESRASLAMDRSSRRDLDDARHEIKFLKSKIEVSDKNYETQTEEVRQLQERCTKLTGELVACQQKYDTDMEAMRSGHEVELKETRKRERLLIKQE